MKYCETTGKINYETRHEAITAGNFMNSRRGTGHVRVYQCKFCHCWHLTQQKPRKIRKYHELHAKRKS